MLPLLRYVILLISALGCVACAQQTHPVTKRPIAPVMGVGGADWLDRDERAREERTDKALPALELKPGMKVGDVGAGTGYYSLRMAHLVLPGGMVFANDLQSAMLRRVAAKARAQSITNIKEVQGTETDCKLPEDELDLVLMVDVYHEFSHPQEMLRCIRRSLRPDGRIVLLEYRGEDERVPITPGTQDDAEAGESGSGSRGIPLRKSVETLPWQHMIFFRKADANGMR